jgi:hypothetical protein
MYRTVAHLIELRDEGLAGPLGGGKISALAHGGLLEKPMLSIADLKS